MFLRKELKKYAFYSFLFWLVNTQWLGFLTWFTVTEMLATLETGMEIGQNLSDLIKTLSTTHQAE